MTLTPTLDESQQYLQVEDERLNLFVFAQTREQLVDELGEQLAMLWDEYVDDEPENLSSAALKLREQIQQLIERVDHA